MSVREAFPAMVQFKILTGSRAGATHIVRRFPCAIGRSASADLRLEDAGVWDQHLRLELAEDGAFVAQLLPGAVASLNGQPLERAALRGGDLLEMGAAKVQFFLSEPRQRGLRWLEILFWATLAAITLGQTVLIGWLLR